MAQTYIDAIEYRCPNATLVPDRFHVVKALNNAVDEVRKEQWRQASKEERITLKGLRWLRKWTIFNNSGICPWASLINS